MRKSQVLVGSLVGLILVTTMPVELQAAPKKDRFRGTMHIEEPGDVPPPVLVIDVRLNAQSGPLGEDAKGPFFVRESHMSGLVADSHGRVTCLRVAGNVPTSGGNLVDIAVPVGVVTRSSTVAHAEGHAVIIAVIQSETGGVLVLFSFGAQPRFLVPGPDDEVSSGRRGAGGRFTVMRDESQSTGPENGFTYAASAPKAATDWATRAMRYQPARWHGPKRCAAPRRASQGSCRPAGSSAR
jgi:hypothetical protein